MATPESTMAQTQQPLPPEILLHILTFTDTTTLWLNIRLTTTILRSEVEKLALKSWLPNLTLWSAYSLGTGVQPRWYDVRAKISLSFTEISTNDSNLALFSIASVDARHFRERALERWKSNTAGYALKGAMNLLATLDGTSGWYIWSARANDQKHEVFLRGIRETDDGGIWCDWRQLLDSYHRPELTKEAVKKWYPGPRAGLFA